MTKLKFTNKLFYFYVMTLLTCDFLLTVSKIPNGKAVHYIRLFVVLITIILSVLKISPAKNVIKIWSVVFFMLGPVIVLFASVSTILLSEIPFSDQTDRIFMPLILLLLGVILYLGSDKFIFDPSIDK